MATKPESTPLMALLRLCGAEQRNWLAERAGTTTNYLYALAGCHREQPRVGLAFAIEDASTEMHGASGGDTPIVTARQLAAMCSLTMFEDMGV